MADPVSATAITSLVAAGIGTGLSILGNIEQGQAAAKNAAYQAQVAKNNQIIAGQNATAAIQSGEAKAAEVGSENRARLGMIEADQAASGLDINSGSPVDVRASQRETGVYDTQMTEHNAYLQAYGYQAQASNFGSQAGLDTAAESQARSSIPLTTAATLAEGASSLGNKYAQFQTHGVFGN